MSAHTQKSDQAKQLKPKGTSSFLNVMWLLLCLSKTVLWLRFLSQFFSLCLFVCSGYDFINIGAVCVRCAYNFCYIFACFCNQYMGDNLHTHTDAKLHWIIDAWSMTVFQNRNALRVLLAFHFGQTTRLCLAWCCFVVVWCSVVCCVKIVSNWNNNHRWQRIQRTKQKPQTKRERRRTKTPKHTEHIHTHIHSLNHVIDFSDMISALCISWAQIHNFGNGDRLCFSFVSNWTIIRSQIKNNK